MGFSPGWSGLNGVRVREIQAAAVTNTTTHITVKINSIQLLLWEELILIRGQPQ